MIQSVFWVFGVNEAGTTLVWKPVDPKRMDPKKPPFAPEVFLSEWDRKGLAWVSATLGEMLLRLLNAPYTNLVPPVEE
ncbi:MAG: hypothetical protein JWP34_565 [Massilia sp.]|nr:hypothetical protein [Massilia sp.]